MSERTSLELGALAADPGAPRRPAGRFEVAIVGLAAGGGEGLESTAFDGSPGRVLDELLAGVQLRRELVLCAGVLDAPRPGNRDPRPDELAAGVAALGARLAAAEVVVVCTLGTAATAALRGGAPPDPALHGRPEPIIAGGRAMHLLPMHHPAAALYAPALLPELQRDVGLVRELLARPPEQPEPEPEPEAEPEVAAPGGAAPAKPPRAAAGEPGAGEQPTLF